MSIDGTASQLVSVTINGSNDELLQNGSFENETYSGAAWDSFGSVPGWTTVPGSAPLEIVGAGYFGINGDGHWLDTQASPGGIDIKQQVDLITNHLGTLSFSVAKEDTGGIKTDPTEHLEFWFNNSKVADITTVDLAADNSFQTFSVQVTGQPGPDTLEIHSTGHSGSVGFALDKVSLVS